MKYLIVILLLAALAPAAQAQQLSLKKCPTGYAPMWEKTATGTLVQKCYKYEKPRAGETPQLVNPLK